MCFFARVFVSKIWVLFSIFTTMPGYFKILLKDILKRPSLYFFLFLIVFTMDRHHRYESTKGAEGTFYSDVKDYYMFLPNGFLRHDDSAKTEMSHNKRTIGMAILYTPAFAVGHVYARLSGQATDGYSLPYQWSIRWGSIIYSLIGLWFLRRSLLMFFTEAVTAITIAGLIFGTNLFYYTYSWGELPHSYLFCLYAVFIFHTLQWLLHCKGRSLLWLAFLTGFITLVRPTGIVVLLFPLLWDVKSIHDIRARIRFIFGRPAQLALPLLLFMLPLLAQMFCWYSLTGRPVYYSYGTERFFFNDPQIINFLLSYRKGWLVYTPIMLFALVGFLISYWRARQFFWFNVIYFAVTVYVLSSWWEWSYGGSFGCRALVESYSFFAFPFAAAVHGVWYVARQAVLKYTLRGVLLLVFYLLVQVNIIQSLQCKYGILHWNGMNKQVYWYIFLKTDFSPTQYDTMNRMVKEPDYNKMIQGDRDF